MRNFQNFKGRSGRSFTKRLFVLLILAPAWGFGADRLPGAPISPKAGRAQVSCQAALAPLRSLDLKKRALQGRVIYVFDIPGLFFLAEFSQNPDLLSPPQLHRFVLDYDPQRVGWRSPYRSILGAKPLQYSEADLRAFGQSVILSKGEVMEFFLRLPNDPNKSIDHGPVLFVPFESGHLYGFPAGTNLDEEMRSLALGSIVALGKFVSGLVLEVRLEQRHRTPEAGGEFFIEEVSPPDLQTMPR